MIEVVHRKPKKLWGIKNGNYTNYLRAIKKFINKYLTHGNNMARAFKLIYNQGNPRRDAKRGLLNKHFVNYSLTRAMAFAKTCSSNSNAKAEKTSIAKKIDRMYLEWPIIFLYPRTRIDNLIKIQKATSKKTSDAYDDYMDRKPSRQDIEVEIHDRKYAGNPDIIIVGKVMNAAIRAARRSDVRLVLESLQLEYPKARIIYFRDICLEIQKEKLETAHNMYSCVAWMIADFFNKKEVGIDLDKVNNSEL